MIIYWIPPMPGCPYGMFVAVPWGWYRISVRTKGEIT